jgi:hypothetical protein
LCGLWIVLTPGIGEACHINKSWFNQRSNQGTVEFQVVVVVVRINCEIWSVRNKHAADWYWIAGWSSLLEILRNFIEKWQKDMFVVVE